MKKVLAIVLALAMILGSFSFVAAGTSTEYNDVAGTKYEGAVAVLGALDIVSGYPDGTFKPAKVVTRAEMCKLIITALGLDDYVAGSYAAYPDVAGSHWATSYIAYATSLGVINGYPDGTFKPENPVTYQEAAAMLVRALGYQDQYLVGSWPASHVNVAMSAGILKDVAATAAGANRGDIALMVYNSLTSDMIQYNSYGQQTYAGSMLDRMGAFKVENVVINQNDVYWAQKNFGLDLNAYLGAYGDVYKLDVKKDGYDVTKGDGVIVFAKEKATLLTGEFRLNGSDDSTFVVGDTAYKFTNDTLNRAFAYVLDKDGNIVKDDQGQNKTTDLCVDFYNGTTVGAKKVSAMTDKAVYTIAANLKGIYIDTVYSIGAWEADAELKWTEDDADTLADDDKIGSLEFQMTKTDEIDMGWVALEGVEDLATIAKDAIVTVYADANDKYITKIGVSTDTVSGKITKEAGVPTNYTIGDAAYKASKKADFSPALGDEGTFFLNYKGELSYFNKSSYAGNYAVVVKEAAKKPGYTLGEAYQIYLMTKDGEKAAYDFKDVKTYTDTKAASLTVGDVITFKTNAEGKILDITSIFDADDQYAQSAVAKTAVAEAGSLNDKGIMDGKLISDAVVVFDIKAKKEDKTPDFDKWGLGAVANLKTVGFDGKGIAYNTNKDGQIDLIVISTPENTKAVTNLGIVTGTYKTFNDKNEEIVGGTAIVNGAVVDFTTTEKMDLAKDQIYNLTYKGAAVSGAASTDNAVASDVPVKEANFKSTQDYAYYKDGNAGKKVTADGDFVNMVQVVKKADGTVDLGIADDLTTKDKDESVPDYQYIGAATNFYKVNLKAVDDKSFEFDKLSIGSASDVKKGAYVMLFQLDKKSGAWDTIVYVTADDAKKITWAQ